MTDSNLKFSKKEISSLYEIAEEINKQFKKNKAETNSFSTLQKTRLVSQWRSPFEKNSLKFPITINLDQDEFQLSQYSDKQAKIEALNRLSDQGVLSWEWKQASHDLRNLNPISLKQTAVITEINLNLFESFVEKIKKAYYQSSSGADDSFSTPFEELPKNIKVEKDALLCPGFGKGEIKFYKGSDQDSNNRLELLKKLIDENGDWVTTDTIARKLRLNNNNNVFTIRRDVNKRLPNGIKVVTKKEDGMVGKPLKSAMRLKVTKKQNLH